MQSEARHWGELGGAQRGAQRFERRVQVRAASGFKFLDKTEKGRERESLQGEWAIAVALLSRDADSLSFSAAASACEKAAWDSALQLLRASRPRALEADLLLHSASDRRIAPRIA